MDKETSNLWVVTFVGTGEREQVEYLWSGRSYTTRHFQAALKAWFPNAHFVLLATTDAWNDSEMALKEVLGNAVQLYTIPHGLDDEEFSQIYAQIASALPDGAEVIFDITHGFRSLPVLGLLSLSYLREAKDVRVKHILYGALREEELSAEVVDLVPFLGMFDWAQATQRYIDIGDARYLAKVMRETAGLGAFGGMDADLINKLAGGMESLSNALLSNNPPAAGRQAKALLSTLEEAERALGQQESGEADHPIKLLLGRLQEQLKRMAFDHKSDDDATVLAALFNIMAWYYKYHYTEKAAALANEWLFFLGKHQEGRLIRDNEYKLKDLPDILKQLHDEIRGDRNDAMHMNLDEIRKGKEGRSYEEFRRAVGRALQELGKQARIAGLKGLASIELHD